MKNIQNYIRKYQEKTIGRVICAVRGHRYPGVFVFNMRSLYFCDCCGRELLGRTFNDIEPMTDEDIEMMHRFGEV